MAVMPILNRWLTTTTVDFPNYLAGSQGPQSADALLVADGREWRRI
jgi:glucose-6-phosphate 1-dehydrogenase